MALPVMAAAALAGRLLLAAIFLHEAWSKLTGYSAALAYMQAFGVPGQLLPLAIATGAGSGSENAVGRGVIGGMLSATFLAPFLIPMFFFVVTGKLFKPKNEPAPASPSPAALESEPT